MNANEKKIRMVPGLLIAFCITAFIAIAWAGVWYIGEQRKAVITSVWANLRSIAKLRSLEICQWRQERVDSIEYAISAFISEGFVDWLSTRAEYRKKTLRVQCRSLSDRYSFVDAFLLDTDNNILISASGVPAPLCDDEVNCLDSVRRLNSTCMTEFYQAAGEPRISFATPITNRLGVVRGFMMIRADPRKFLYPLLQSWPVPSVSAETLLVRKEGDHVLFLNDLRFSEDAALKLKISVTSTNTPAVHAVLGKMGFVDGTDYRGRKVFAEILPVPSSSWFIISKIDQDEVMAVLHEQAWLVSLIIAVLLLALAGLVGLAWQMMAKQQYVSLYNSERELRESQGRYQALLSAIPDIIMEVDSYRRYVWANAPGIEFFGNDCIGREALYYFAGERETYDKLQPLFEGEQKLIYLESWQKRKDGQERLLAWSCRSLIDPSGKVTGALFSARDITEKILMERMVQEGSARFQSLYNNMAEGMALHEIVCDDSGKPVDYRIVDVNPQYERILGIRRDAVTGRLSKEVYGTDEPPYLEQFLKVAKTGKPFRFETYFQPMDRYFEISVCAWMGDRGFATIFSDTTERRKLQESIQLASKMESIGLLAGGIAHDFNNLLTGIFGYIDIAQDNLRGSDLKAAEDALAKAFSVSERARALTHQLLTFSKGGAPVRKIYDAAALVQKSALFAVSGSNVKCRFEVDKDLWMCNCDESQIGQVIDNIIINGQQAMPTGGSISIRLTNAGRDAAKPVTLQSDVDYVRISIKDTGIGIPANILPRIFDPFFTTKSKGHGLGLATSFSIVKQHGGVIEVESTPGKGSEFIIYLPAVSGGVVKAEEKKEAVSFKGSGTVLVMDDEEYMRGIMSVVLKKLGYTPLVAENGEKAVAAVRKAKQDGVAIRAVLLDLTVPAGMGGVEALEAIRSIDPGLPAVAISGYSDDPAVARPAEHGFSSSLQKPYTKNQLSQVLAAVARKS